MGLIQLPFQAAQASPPPAADRPPGEEQVERGDGGGPSSATPQRAETDSRPADEPSPARRSSDEPEARIPAGAEEHAEEASGHPDTAPHDRPPAQLASQGAVAGPEKNGVANGAPAGRPGRPVAAPGEGAQAKRPAGGPPGRPGGTPAAPAAPGTTPAQNPAQAGAQRGPSAAGGSVTPIGRKSPPSPQNAPPAGPAPVVKPGAPPRGAPIADRAELRGLALVPPEILQLEVSELLRGKRDLFLLRVFLFVALPTLLVTAYVFIYATPRYVSEFQAIYHSNEAQMQSSMLGGLLGMSGSVDMNAAVIAYLQSPALLADVDKQLDLRPKFSDPSVDWLDRLSAGATTETFLSYFQRRVSAYENSAGYVVVDAEGFSPSEAQKLAEALTSSAERMVASISQREKLDMVKFTEEEVQRCEREYLAAVDRLTEFRERHRDYDFSGSEQLLTGTVGALETQLAGLRSRLTSAQKFLGEDAPTVAVIRSDIAGLESQIAEEQARLASRVRPKAPAAAERKAPRKPSVEPSEAARLSDSLASSEAARLDERRTDDNAVPKAPYSQLLATYLKLSQDQQFATALLQTAKQAAENARLEAGKQSAYLFTFIPPSLPQRSMEPSPTRYILTTLVGCMLAYFALSILFGLFHHETRA